MKANHNQKKKIQKIQKAVSYITKLLNWKQITTKIQFIQKKIRCFLYNKVTKLKANHNEEVSKISEEFAVSYITKLLNWKQITTISEDSEVSKMLFPI